MLSIGYNQVGGNWEWVDGSQNGFTNWAPGESQNMGVPEAAVIRLVDGKWAAADKQAIFNYICSEPLVQPIMSSSNVPGSTITSVAGSTSPSPALDCNVDIAMILDASDALSDTDFFLMNQFLAYNLTVNWYINPSNGSEAGVFLNTDTVDYNEQGYFNFNNQADLACSIMQHAGMRFGGGSSIANGLKSFDSILYNGQNRQGFGTVILQITYASAIDDIKEAYKIIQLMKAEYNINYILVGVGPNITSDIFDLTEFTLKIPDFKDPKLADSINALICQKSPLTVTFPATTTQQLTSSAAQQTTTFGDYEPEDADIVIVIDASVNCTPNLFDEKTLIQNLVTTKWTHFERIGLATYATTVYSQWMDYNDPHNSYDVFMEKLDDLPIHMDQTGSVAKSGLGSPGALIAYPSRDMAGLVAAKIRETLNKNGI
ncbi:hypothetical protein WR25_07582 isoform B [Diploscapter pachys]|nr:hypothetical protein WR25_07582 isoform B [Diploscapter pachys]